MRKVKLRLSGVFSKFIVCFLFSGVAISCTEEKPKIGFLFPNLVQKRYLSEKDLFAQKVNELGGTAITMSAENDDMMQIKQASELIDQGVKVLVVNSVNANTAAAIVRIAHEKNVPVIAYDRLIRNCDLDYFLSFDNEKVGQLMAEYVIKLKPTGKYILLGGDKRDQNAIWVKKGQLKTLEPLIKSNAISIVYDTYIEDWSGENAKVEIRKYLDLSSEKPDVILSSYDGMSTSVIDLLIEYRLNKLIDVTGQDAEVDACRNIVKENQVMTVYKSLKNLANKAAELSMKIAGKEKIEEEFVQINNGKIEMPSILLNPVVVDKNNLKSTIIADGFLTEAEISK
jgi:D-xylose ABC transporter substrate-binding protein